MVNIWNVIADISAVATLILFLLYFIGRLWSVHINKKFSYEKITVLFPIDDAELDVYNINGDAILKILSGQYLNWIKVYSFEYKDEQCKKIDKKLLDTIRKININEPVYLGVELPEVIPNILIEFQRFDYVIGSFILYPDGRGIGYNSSDFEFRNTFRTFLYYLVK